MPVVMISLGRPSVREQPASVCFLVGTTDVVRLRNLSRKHMPLDNVHAGLPWDAPDPSYRSIEQQAEEYLAALGRRGVRPRHLSGFCNGGLVAHAAALRLQAEGRPVESLALIEPLHPELRPPPLVTDMMGIDADAAGERSASFIADVAGVEDERRRGLGGAGLVEAVARMVERHYDQVTALRAASGWKRVASDRRQHVNFIMGMTAQMVAAVEYRPLTYRGDVTLVYGDQPDGVLARDPALWGTCVTGAVRVLPLAGDHADVLDAPELAPIIGPISAAAASG